MRNKESRGVIKKRNSNNRTRNNVFLLACEGDNKTEKNYFQCFNSDNVKIRFVPGNETDPENMMMNLIDKYEEYDLDPCDGNLGFCLVDSDFDERKDNQLKKAEILSKDCDGVSLIVSSPCFEIWFLCHFIFSTKQYRHYKEVEKDTKQYIKDYTKESKNVYDTIKDKTDKAINNAKKLEQVALDDGKVMHTVSFMPSTEVYKIIDVIKNSKS